MSCCSGCVCSEAAAGPWFWRAEPCCKIPERCNIQKMSDHVSETCSTQRPHVPCNTPTSFLWFPQRPMTDFIPGLCLGVRSMQLWGPTPHVWPRIEWMLLLMTFSSVITASMCCCWLNVGLKFKFSDLLDGLRSTGHDIKKYVNCLLKWITCGHKLAFCGNNLVFYAHKLSFCGHILAFFSILWP